MHPWGGELVVVVGAAVVVVGGAVVVDVLVLVVVVGGRVVVVVVDGVASVTLILSRPTSSAWLTTEKRTVAVVPVATNMSSSFSHVRQ